MRKVLGPGMNTSIDPAGLVDIVDDAESVEDAREAAEAGIRSIRGVVLPCDEEIVNEAVETWMARSEHDD